MKTTIYPFFIHKMRNALFLLLLTVNFLSVTALFADSGFYCPPDITLGCCSDYSNTDITGHPGDTNLDYSNFSFNDEVHLNECREGYVIRTWTAYLGSTAYYCEQIITMEYENDFDGKINWPPHWQGYCGDEIPYLEPSYDRGFCDMIAHTYNDDTLRFVGNACMKILRNWKVVDWCKYIANSPSDEGVWEYTQVFKIYETSKPVFDKCEDWNVKANESDCTANVVLSKSATDEHCNYIPVLNWRIEFDLNNDWSVDSIAVKTGDSIFFEIKGLPVGEHKVVWKVSDRCGNVSQCMETLYVEDGKDPTPYCYLSMPLVLMPSTNTLPVNANHFMKKAEDNCSEESDLIHSWSPDASDSVKIFDCNDTGFQFLPVYTIDEAGNYDYCFVFSFVTTHGNCQGGSFQQLVSGQILDFSGHPVSGLKVSLANNPYNLHVVDTTMQEGRYSFPYVETIAEPHMYFTDAHPVSVHISTLDMVILMKYLLGLFQPSDPDGFLVAADINKDGELNTLDLVQMKDLVLGLTNRQSISNSELRIFVPDQDNEGQFTEVESIADFQSMSNIRVIRVGDLERFLLD